MTTPKRMAVSLVAVSALVLGACGDDDDAGDTSPVTDAPAVTDDRSDGTVTDEGGDEDDIDAEDDGDDDPADEGGQPATVVVTTSIWSDVVTTATCASATGLDIVTLIPADADPHRYEASLQDREVLEGADIVVANGLDFEAGFADLLSTVDDDRLVEVASLPTIRLREDDHDDHGHDDDHADDDHADDDHDHADDDADDDHADDDHDHADDDADDDHDHSGGDPHVWMDPQMVADSVHPIVDAIAAATGADAGELDDCADDYVEELEMLDDEIAGLLGALSDEQRLMVTNHDSYGYFADRYGLEILGTVLPSTSTMAETNPADLNDLRNEILDQGASVIVVDAQHSGSDAEALANVIDDVEVVALYSDTLGDNDSYLDMMRSNATALADALGG